MPWNGEKGSTQRTNGEKTLGERGMGDDRVYRKSGSGEWKRKRSLEQS